MNKLFRAVAMAVGAAALVTSVTPLANAATAAPPPAEVATPVTIQLAAAEQA